MPTGPPWAIDKSSSDFGVGHSNSDGNVFGDLRAGATFRGTQRSGRNSYPVVVDIKHVDLARSFICGYLYISGLTDDYPTLTTYFEGELIGGGEHGFVTRKWEADTAVDIAHWEKFPEFKKARGDQGPDEGAYDQDGSCLFMRWKEHFLVPDHRVTQVPGASFSGFYYICYNARTSAITGFYYHQSSEWFQSLELQAQRNDGLGAYAFR